MALAIRRINLVPRASDGNLDSRFPDGDDGTPAIPLAWAVVPDQNWTRGVSTTLDLSAYLTEPVPANSTYSLFTDPGITGVSLVGAVLTYDGTGSGADLGGCRVTATDPETSATATCATFVVNMAAAPGAADSVAPTIPLDLVGTAVSSSQVDLSWFASSDAAVSGQDQDGLKDYDVYRGASVFTTVTAADLALAPQFSHVEVGSPVPSGSGTQSGSDWLIVAEGLQIYGTADQFGGAFAQVAGNFRAWVKVEVFTSTNQYSKAGLMVRESLAAGSRHATLMFFPPAQGRGIKLEHRLTTDGLTTDGPWTQGVPAPGILFVERSGSTLTFLSSTDGNAPASRGSVSLPMSDPVYILPVVASQANGVSVTVQFRQLTVAPLTRVTVSDTGRSASTTYAYTVRARDNAATPNVSSQSASISVTTQAAPASERPYPRLGCISIGQFDHDTSAAITHHAKKQVIIYAAQDGWQSGKLKTHPQWQNEVRDLSPYPVPPVFLHYVNPNIQYKTTSSGQPSDIFRVAASTGKWFVLDDYPDGTPVNSYWGVNHYIINALLGGNLVGGDTCQQRWSKYTHDYTIDGGAGGYSAFTNAANTDLDGLFFDDVRPKMGVDGDYARTGSMTGQKNDPEIQALYREGQRARYDAFKTRYPTKLLAGNLSNYFGTNVGLFSPLFTALFEAGCTEHLIGNIDRVESGGFDACLAKVIDTLAIMIAPKLLVCVHDGVALNGSDPVDATAYRPQRYGLALVGLTDGFYFPTSTLVSSFPNSTDRTRVYDEHFGGEINEYGWAGNANGPYTVVNGLYKRDFQFGECWVNPKGAGARTNVSLGAGSRKRLTGTQAPSINSGATLTTWSPADRDGLWTVKIP